MPETKAAVTTPYPSPPATSAAPVTHSALRTTHSPYGRILSDVHGFALYRFTHDQPGSSSCYDACAKAWPPYLVRSRPSKRGPGGGTVGTVRRRDGRLQVNYAGHPLYYYVGDKHPGQVLCQGAVEYGGTWLVLPAA